MFKRVALTVCLMAGCVWCLALATRADSTQSEPAGLPFKPVAPIDSLMHGQKTFFKEITQELGKSPGEDRNHEIKEAADVLAELANVNRHNKNKEDFRAWATQLRDTALQLSAEADRKELADEVRLRKLYRKLKATCEACHDVYQ